MPGPYKGFSTQHTTKQEHAKPRHQPSNRDQRSRDRLRNKASAFQAKIKSPAYIALGAAALQTVYETFDPDFPVSFHLPTLATETAANTILTLYVIQKDRHCMPTSDYCFTNIQPDPIIIPPHRGNDSSSTPQWAAAKDPIPQQTDTLKPGKTRVYPSMLAEKTSPSIRSHQLHHHISSRPSNGIPFIKLVFHQKRRFLTWQKTTLLIAQQTQATQQIQAAATADSNQLESLLLSSLAANDSSPPQVNYGP